MDRVVSNRWVILSASLLALAGIYVTVNRSFHEASAPAGAVPQDRFAKEHEREARDGAMAEWQDESNLIDRTGDDEPGEGATEQR